MEDVQTPALPMPQWELVIMVAALMSLNALAIDIMLPALSNISEHYSLTRDNDQQLVIFAYIAGFGAPQLVFGPISDRFGRKGLLSICLIAYAVAGVACITVALGSVPISQSASKDISWLAIITLAPTMSGKKSSSTAMSNEIVVTARIVSSALSPGS